MRSVGTWYILSCRWFVTQGERSDTCLPDQEIEAPDEPDAVRRPFGRCVDVRPQPTGGGAAPGDGRVRADTAQLPPRAGPGPRRTRRPRQAGDRPVRAPVVQDHGRVLGDDRGVGPGPAGRVVPRGRSQQSRRPVAGAHPDRGDRRQPRPRAGPGGSRPGTGRADLRAGAAERGPASRDPVRGRRGGPGRGQLRRRGPAVGRGGRARRRCAGVRHLLAGLRTRARCGGGRLCHDPGRGRGAAQRGRTGPGAGPARRWRVRLRGDPALPLPAGSCSRGSSA